MYVAALVLFAVSDLYDLLESGKKREQHNHIMPHDLTVPFTMIEGGEIRQLTPFGPFVWIRPYTDL